MLLLQPDIIHIILYYNMFFIFLLYVYYGILYNGVSMLFLRHLCLIMYFGISILYAQDINEVSTTPTTQPMIPLNETRKLELAGNMLKTINYH